MLRSYRHIIFALVGWVSLAAQQPNLKTEREQASAQNAIPQRLGDIATPQHQESERAHRTKPESDYCGPGQYQSKTDLCAQWKAADAAAASARWTYVGNWIGGVSGVLVLIALGLAFHSNWIARDTAKRQLRAYISIESADLQQVCSEGIRPQINVIIRNTGQTPAQDFRIDGDVYLRDADFGCSYVSEIPDHYGTQTIGAGVSRPIYAILEKPADSRRL